jgi:hypothetical protein
VNVYVVSECEWYRESVVIGAATSRELAERVADRADRDGDLVEQWSPWKEDVNPGEGHCSWFRDALYGDGAPRPLYQEIVVVPLDGSD